MKIEYIKGDLFTTDIKYIVHGCNDQGAMGSGVAKTIREKYTEAYKQYVLKWRDFGLKLGEVQYVETNGKVIVNAISQDNYGRDGRRYVSYEAITDIMKTLEKDLSGKIDSIAMPQIGAGLGGGDWNIISEIIEKELISIQPVVYIL